MVTVEVYVCGRALIPMIKQNRGIKSSNNDSWIPNESRSWTVPSPTQNLLYITHTTYHKYINVLPYQLYSGNMHLDRFWLHDSKSCCDGAGFLRRPRPRPQEMTPTTRTKRPYPRPPFPAPSTVQAAAATHHGTG